MLWSIDSFKKRIRWPVSQDCIAGSSVQLIEVMCFFKLSADQLLVFIDRTPRFIIKMPTSKGVTYTLAVEFV